MVETEDMNKLCSNIPTSNINELNELIYSGVTVWDKIGIHLRNLNRNTKSGWGIKLE